MPKKSIKSSLCPHCGSEMRKIRMPLEGGYEGEIYLVCFSDLCPYFVKGWEWMMQKYEVNASYRHRLSLATGGTGPLPVWSPDALKDRIID